MKPLGLPFASRVAFYLAREATGQRETQVGRDYSGVKSIVCVLLRETGASLPDIAELVYGNRRRHSAVHEQIGKWKTHTAAQTALTKFRAMLEN